MAKITQKDIEKISRLAQIEIKDDKEILATQIENVINWIEEPFINAQIITAADYVGPIIGLCMEKRGLLKNQVYLTATRVELTFELPLSEVVFDFFDMLLSFFC
jgi:translation elongation factor EF-4